MTNQERVTHAFDAMRRGDSQPWIDLLDENIRFEFVGGGTWGGVYQGKKDWRENFARYVVAHIAPPFRQFPARFTTEGDRLVLEFRTENETRSGRPYHNRYCMIMEFRDGKVVDLTEYSDTALTISVIGEKVMPGEAA